MKFLVYIYILFNLQYSFAQEEYYLNVKNVAFFQNDILLNDEIVFQIFTLDNGSLEISYPDGKLFLKTKKNGDNILYYFPEVNFYFLNEKFNDYKELYKYMTYYNVFDENLSLDTTRLIKFLAEYNKF